MAFESAGAVAKTCRDDHVAILYVTQGLEDRIEEIRSSLSGVDVLSVAAIPEYVPRGVVIGFEVVSGKPKILLNLRQAKAQNVNFKADVLSLMKVLQ